MPPGNAEGCCARGSQSAQRSRLNPPAASIAKASVNTCRRGSGLAINLLISSNRVDMSGLLSGGGEHSFCELQNFFDSLADIAGDYTFLVDPVGYRSQEDRILLRYLPFLLKQHRTTDSKLSRLLPVLLDIAATDDYDHPVPLLTLHVQQFEVAGEAIAGTAMGIREYEQNLLP